MITMYAHNKRPSPEPLEAESNGSHGSHGSHISHSAGHVQDVPLPISIPFYDMTFLKYSKLLRKVNYQLVEVYRQHKLFAFTRMVGGSFMNFYPPGMELFRSIQTSIIRGESLIGLSERIQLKLYNDVWTGIFSPFFDLDIYTNDVLELLDIREFVEDVLFPCFREFFDFDEDDIRGGLHLAMFASQDDDGKLHQKSRRTSCVVGVE